MNTNAHRVPCADSGLMILDRINRQMVSWVPLWQVAHLTVGDSHLSSVVLAISISKSRQVMGAWTKLRHAAA